MVKFIDKSRKDDACKDEILIRCDCGNEILSIGVVNGVTEDKKVIPVLRFKFYQCGNGACKNIKEINKSALIHFGEPEAIATIHGLLTGNINNGHGYVEAQEGSFIGIDLGEDDVLSTIHFVFNEKQIHKIYKCIYNNNLEKADKHIAWSIGFSKPELDKLVAFITKITDKLDLPAEESNKKIDGETEAETKPSSNK